MNIRAIAMLCLAALLGAVAVFLARDWIESQVPAQVVITKDRVPLTKIVVARRDLFLGDRLKSGNLEAREWPSDAVPARSFESIDELISEDRVVLRSIAANEPILASKITGKDGRASLSAVISKTMRAVTIRVNDVQGVAGFVLPGDHVDVLLTREQNKKQPYNIVLLQNIKVLGIDQDANQQNDKPKLVRAVTIEVTLPQAQKLALAPKVGSMSLALRNMIDVEPDRTRVIDLADLGDGEANGIRKEGPAPPVARLPAKSKPQTTQQTMEMPKATKGTPEASPNPKAGSAPKRVVERRTPTPELMARVTVTRELNSEKYRVPQAGQIKKPGLEMDAGDPLFGMAPGISSPAPLNRTITKALSNADGGRSIDLQSGFAPARRHCRIKGNVTSKGERIYHVPGSRNYDRTRIELSKGERWFCSEVEAEGAGWRRSLP